MNSVVVVLPGRPLAETIAFFREQLHFRLDAIRPADDPAVATLRRGATTICLDVAHVGDPGVVRIEAADERDVTAPNGTQVQFRRPFELQVPPAVGRAGITRRRDADGWIVGRAGMRYRDLIPSRLGGHLIASHIRIDEGGPVPDDVHFHDVRCQLIYCVRGWVRLVYEDQGEPFVMKAGECVLQPPTIRHRVLECSSGLEVVELASPAQHQTTLDHELELPTARVDAARVFGGQRFHVFRHEREDAVPTDSIDLGFGDPTGGSVEVQIAVGSGLSGDAVVEDRLTFCFVLRSACDVTIAGERSRLETGDAMVVPAGTAWSFTDVDPDAACLIVRM